MSDLVQFQHHEIGRRIAENEAQIGQTHMMPDERAGLGCLGNVVAVGERAAFGAPADFLAIGDIRFEQHVHRGRSSPTVVVQGSGGQTVIENKIAKAARCGLPNASPLIHVVVEINQRWGLRRTVERKIHPVMLVIDHAGLHALAFGK